VAKPAKKAPEIEKFLTKLLGSSRIDAIEKDLCVPAPIGCGGPAKFFRNAISERDYTLSGMCQTCQDQVQALMDRMAREKH